MAKGFTVKPRLNLSTVSEKLKNFPTIHFIGIESRRDRIDGFVSMTNQYQISNIVPHVFQNYRHGDCNIKFFGPFYTNGFPEGHFGCLTSHLKVLYEWYNTTDEPYIFVCEDDLSLETVQYWNFTWEEFFKRLPENWDVVQLCLLRYVGKMFEFFDPDVHCRNRCWCDWSSAAYLMSRNHVKNLLDTYYDGKTFIYDYLGYDKNSRWNDLASPAVETILFTYFTKETKLFTFPLFIEDYTRGSNSTHWSSNSFNFRDYSRSEILNWWKGRGRTMELDKIFGYL